MVNNYVIGVVIVVGFRIIVFFFVSFVIILLIGMVYGKFYGEIIKIVFLGVIFIFGNFVNCFMLVV